MGEPVTEDGMKHAIAELRYELGAEIQTLQSELKDLYGKFLITNMQLGQMGIELSPLPEEAKAQMREQFRERALEARQSLGNDPGYAEAIEFLEHMLAAYR